ncbi:H-NS histone family protein [uncultured Paraglaciecola sp.]|uniref:H-NS histone family protein n=1 Tax=uncultured Paraglaciecola sp. TaxID=1765024 RepID=UPI002615C71A|nr:H-NS histone family protein [uncultured Paraglaciecola sp.]
MMSFEQLLSSVKDLTFEQLTKLEEEVSLRKDEHIKKIKEIQEFAMQRGIEIDQAALLHTHTEYNINASDGRSKVEPKYRYVDENGKEFFWSGRGVSPKWAREAKEEGTLDKYKI